METIWAFCSWCKKSYVAKYGDYATDNSTVFSLHYKTETFAVDSGACAWGYKVDGICNECAGKLYDELMRLGIQVKEIDY